MPQRWPRRLVLGMRTVTNNKKTRGVVQVGILVSPSMKYGFDRYVFTPSIANSMKTQILQPISKITREHWHTNLAPSTD